MLNSNKKRFWAYAPYWGFNKILPFSIASDEYNRKTYVFGYPFTGQLVFASKKGYDVVVDRKANMLYVELEHEASSPAYSIRTVRVDEKVNFDYNRDTGELIGIEVFL